MTKKIAISVKHLGKKYKLGGPQEKYHTLRDAIVNSLNAPLKRFHRAPPDEGFWALKDVSFDVGRGEVVGIIGRNGAGKSTLLKILSRITSPTEGTVELHGRVGSLLEVGTGFHPEMTGRENIFLNGSILGMRKQEIEQKFDEIVKFAEIEKFLDTPVKRYSSGMYIRLAFAVAAHLEPEILVIDEVLAVGDAAFQKKCLGKMGSVAREGRTVLFVSHNMGAISTICKRALLIDSGKIIGDGVPVNVINDYLHQNITNTGNQSLLHHPNRIRGFKPLLTHFSTNLQNGIADYGKSLVLTIGYNFITEISDPKFIVSVYTIEGSKVFTLNSLWQSNNIPSRLVGCGEIICQVDNLPLLPGEYYISLDLWQFGINLDRIENVTCFQVEWIDKNNAPTYWNSLRGSIYVDSKWIAR